MITPDDATQARVAGLPSSAPRDVQFAPGTMVADRYRIVSLNGSGGMGEVYRADDVKLGQRVALKHIPPHFALEQLYREVRIGREITHPNVCRLHDVVEAGGRRFISMEYVDGEDLASLLRRIERLPAGKAEALTRDLCAGLAAAHDRGVIHRDLKPANVMIDGRGRARITDFGLATFAGEDARDSGGTLLYMAPEQLATGTATVRSDIYALGLVLYEMFTGRRLFDARTHEELREQHAAARTRPSSLVRELDPSIERVILRCVEEDPALRPASVREVMAMLPGTSDPLRAAVAVGQTPSPELVVAAGRSGELSRGRAWTLLVLALLLFAGLAVARSRRTVLGHLDEVKSPETLSDRARTIVRAFGFERAPHAGGFFLPNGRAIRDAVSNGSPLGAAAVPYLYRESPAPLVPANPYGMLRVDDPPFVTSGMTSIVLDAAGALREWRRVPPPRIAAPAAPFDWRVAFREAGLEPAEFRAAEPRWLSPVPATERHAWVSETMRVEAGSVAGSPVWFAVLEAGAAPVSESAMLPRTDDSLAVVLAATVAIAMFVARRNVVRGRADLRGAQRIGMFCAAAHAAASLLVARHAASAGAEWTLIGQLAGGALFTGVIAWICYLAIEPFVRRRWPHMLIGWTRLVSGRPHDPLVGTEVLAGLIAGAAATILNAAVFLAASRFLPIVPSNPLTLAQARTPGGAIAAIPGAAATAITFALGIATIFVLIRLLVRHDLAAWVTAGAVIALGGGGFRLTGFLGAATVTIAVLVALRFAGVLGTAAAFFVYYLGLWTPFTLSTGAWYFARSAFTLAVLSALAISAFRLALAGKPLFGSMLIEDEAKA